MPIVLLILGLVLGALAAALLLRPRLRAAEGRAAEADSARALAEQRLADHQQAEQQLADRFRTLSSEVLRQNRDEFIALAKTQIETAHKDGERKVSDLVKPMRETLGKVDTRLEQLERDRRETHGRLTQHLRTVAEGQEKLRTETGALVAALRQPHTRGRWGEMQLRRVIELVGMVPYCDFVEQAQVEGDSGVLRPDVLVSLPGDKRVVIDAKAPLQAFLDAHEAQDDATRKLALARHARHLRDHVKSLGSKAYWEQFEAAPDFVLLFLPGEHFLGAALEAEGDLIEDAARQSVYLATPATLLAMLKAVHYGWQQARLTESAAEVAELGRSLHSRLGTTLEHVEKLGRRLNSAVSAHNDVVGSLERRVLPTARRFVEHGVVSKELPAVEPVEQMARAVQAPELGEGPRGLPPADDAEAA